MITRNIKKLTKEDLIFEIRQDAIKDKTKRSVWLGVRKDEIHLDSPVFLGEQIKIIDVLCEANVFPVLLKWNDTIGNSYYGKVSKIDKRAKKSN